MICGINTPHNSIGNANLATSQASIESFLQMCFEGSGCRIGYEPTKNELSSLSAVDTQGHQRGGGGVCIVPTSQAIS